MLGYQSVFLGSKLLEKQSSWDFEIDFDSFIMGFYIGLSESVFGKQTFRKRSSWDCGVPRSLVVGEKVGFLDNGLCEKLTPYDAILCWVIRKCFSGSRVPGKRSSWDFGVPKSLVVGEEVGFLGNKLFGKLIPYYSVLC